MKLINTIILTSAITAMASTTIHAGDLATNDQKFSYIVGMQFGQQIHKKNLEINIDALLDGMRDALSGNPPRLSRDDFRQVLMAKQKEEQKKQEKQNLADKDVASNNIKEGVAFLAANKLKPGVQSLANGIQYLVLKTGNGQSSPTANSNVVVHYEGTTTAGVVFDSSYKRGKPATFNLGGVIAGFRDSLLKMKTGDKWKVFIPSHLAYGAKRVNSNIGPNQTLIFDLELIEIKS